MRLKENLAREFPPAIDRIQQGRVYMNPVADFDSAPVTLHAISSIHLEQLLTHREIEIMQFILLDKTHQEIASQLMISHRTVEKHRANLMLKLGLKTHTELILFALRHGIIKS